MNFMLVILAAECLLTCLFFVLSVLNVKRPVLFWVFVLLAVICFLSLCLSPTKPQEEEVIYTVELLSPMTGEVVKQCEARKSLVWTDYKAIAINYQNGDKLVWVGGYRLSIKQKTQK